MTVFERGEEWDNCPKGQAFSRSIVSSWAQAKRLRAPQFRLGVKE